MRIIPKQEIATFAVNLLYMARLLLVLGLLLVAVTSWGETLLTDAKVIERTERGFILQVGTQPLVVEDTYQTKYWRSKAPGKREAFEAGALVYCRIKTDADPPQLREMADRATWPWLDSARKDYKRGTVQELDTKYLVLRFDDGSTFHYRATDKSAVKLKGKSASLTEVEAGQIVWVKGRLLPTLDTFLVELTDVMPTAAAKEPTTAKAKIPKMEPLKPEGVLEGLVTRHHTNISMFDIETDRALHITYTANTKFTLDGQTTTKAALQPKLIAKVTYKRDKAGRIVASRVELRKAG